MTAHILTTYGVELAVDLIVEGYDRADAEATARAAVRDALEATRGVLEVRFVDTTADAQEVEVAS